MRVSDPAGASPDPLERPLLGIALRCCSATAFAVMGALLKLASNHGANIVEMLFYRSVGALPLVAVSVFGIGGLAAIRVGNPMAHVSRSILGLASMSLTFGALALLPLAQATTLAYSAPIFATLLSVFLLGESIGGRRWSAVLVGFAGVVLVAAPFGQRLPLPGLAIGIAAAAMQAVVMVTLRQISRSETTTSIVFWFTMATSVAAGVLMIRFGQAHRTADYAILFGAGAFAGVAQLAMTGSLRFAPVATVMPFDYLQIVWASLIGGWLMAAPLSAATVAGASLIAASGIYTGYREARRGRAPAQSLTARA